MALYSVGLHFHANGVRAAMVRVDDGETVATHEHTYMKGMQGVLTSAEPDLARQDPQDIFDGVDATLKGIMLAADKNSLDFNRDLVRGIGVCAIASCPLPVNKMGVPLGAGNFTKGLNAMAWLPFDRTAKDEAAEITAKLKEQHPQVLAAIGGKYLPEWYWSKVLRCARTDVHGFQLSATWVELQDFIPGFLSGTNHPMGVKRGASAASLFGLYRPEWGGFPPEGLLRELHPELGRIREGLGQAAASLQPAGKLTEWWSRTLKVSAETAVAVGSTEAVAAALGLGVSPGTVVIQHGDTSHRLFAASNVALSGGRWLAPGVFVPGMAGVIVELPSPAWALSSVSGAEGFSGAALAGEASRLTPGSTGLLGYVRSDAVRVIGKGAATRPAEIFRALVEGVAFGFRRAIEQAESGGVSVTEVVAGAGGDEATSLLLHVLADVLQRPVRVSRTAQPELLGAAIAGAVAGKAVGDYEEARIKMTGLRGDTIAPNPAAKEPYDRLFTLYTKVVTGNIDDSFVAELQALKGPATPASGQAGQASP